MNKLKLMIAKLFIPKDTLYCHHKFKYNKKKNCYGAKPCRYWVCYNGWEYCKLLHKELDIQDQVKDCGINEK